MFEFGASGTLNFHLSGVTPGSGVSASQIRSEMHLCPESFGYTPIPDVVWDAFTRTPGVAGCRYRNGDAVPSSPATNQG